MCQEFTSCHTTMALVKEKILWITSAVSVCPGLRISIYQHQGPLTSKRCGLITLWYLVIVLTASMLPIWGKEPPSPRSSRTSPMNIDEPSSDWDEICA